MREKGSKAGNMIMTDTGVPSLQRYAWISIGAAIATILLKVVAWKLTGSVGLLSDAIESRATMPRPPCLIPCTP